MGRWATVIGGADEGRVSSLWMLVAALRGRGLSVGGVIQELNQDLDAVDIRSGAVKRLARKATEPTLCSWGFDDEAFASVAGWLEGHDFDVVVLPAARLEAAGRGHRPTIDAALAGRPVVVLAISRSQLANVALELDEPVAALELPAGSASIEAFADRLERVATGLATGGTPAPLVSG